MRCAWLAALTSCGQLRFSSAFEPLDVRSRCFLHVRMIRYRCCCCFLSCRGHRVQCPGAAAGVCFWHFTAPWLHGHLVTFALQLAPLAALRRLRRLELYRLTLDVRADAAALSMLSELPCVTALRLTGGARPVGHAYHGCVYRS